MTIKSWDKCAARALQDEYGISYQAALNFVRNEAETIIDRANATPLSEGRFSERASLTAMDLWKQRHA